MTRAATSPPRTAGRGDVEELFEPYRRGQSPRVDADRGSGVGLSVARSIAQAHDGTLVLRARVAGGVTAELDLPAS
jgi:signal transduction histidine kinase